MSKEEILYYVYQQISKFIDTTNMYIVLYDEAKNSTLLVFEIENGQQTNLTQKEKLSNYLEKQELAKTILNSRKPFLYPNQTENLCSQEKSLNHMLVPFSSVLGVPIMFEDQILGGVIIYNPTIKNRFNSDDLNVLEMAANLAAIAIINVHLYEETKNELITIKQLGTLGTATAALLHRFRNNIGVISPFVKRLHKYIDLDNKEEVGEILDIIERNARDALDIVDRIQTPFEHLEYQPVNINTVLSNVINQIVSVWETSSGLSKIEIRTDFDDSLPLIELIPDQITEVFRNLIDNSLKAMDDEGKLTVTTKFIDNTAYITVQDTGLGIPPTIQNLLFTRPISSSAKGGNAGLGLWLSQLILKNFEGEISIKKSDLTGTTMLVSILVKKSESSIGMLKENSKHE